MLLRAYLFLTVATLFWGGNTVVGKLAVGHVSPMVLNFSRWAVALVIICSISVPQLKKDWPALKRHWWLLLGYGAIGYTAFNGFLYTALKYTTAVNGAIEQGGIPVLIFILNFLLFRIPVSFIQIIGFAISFVGVALTATRGDIHVLLSLALNFGDALLLLAVAAYAVYTIALRWKPAIHWKSLMAASALGGALTGLPLVIWEAANGSMILPDVAGLGMIAYAALLPSLISQVFYVLGVEGIGANRAGLFINLVPVFGTLLSLVILGEALRPLHLIALVLVLGGIAIAEWGKPKQPA
ncbi:MULTISPECIES: DMT family transporter [Alphaproteobacteria]|uniref:Membrane protein n=2 Tax=Alphaproteobacteria TaxID=28211 RepID=A0A512HJM1_9HYPH|nr:MULTISPECIES: DMT family transporter [Alphaproteobacteria]GEO85635.1 membrane protein [Ciceribacter naphthalenivorans]GLR22010.1 membrane protein [Ciceribacter naphthalenivorans]GLT04866.1 membrane protein [Sphingomonas psychrolutea]